MFSLSLSVFLDITVPILKLFWFLQVLLLTQLTIAALKWFESDLLI